MPRVAAEGGEGADDCSQRLAAVGMNGGDVQSTARRPDDVQRLDKLFVRHIVVTGKSGCAVERFVILILELSREQQSDVVLFADVDDLVNQRADLFDVNVFFGHGFASPAVHRQAVCGLVGYAGKQATRERKRSLITDGSK